MASKQALPYENVAIIFGGTGLVGRELVKKLANSSEWKVYAVARSSEKMVSFTSPNCNFISCDLLDAEETKEKLSSLDDVTHVFWLTWASKYPLDSTKCCEQNKAMMSNSLNAILLKAKRLTHISLQTGMKHYIPRDGSFVWETILYEEDHPRGSGANNFYYMLEDLLKETLPDTVTWSVLRPGLLIGSSTRTYYNVVGSLGVYAAICKHLNLPFLFGGTKQCWEDAYIDGSDARLVAEQHIWASTNVEARSTDGQAFNSINRTSCVWKEIWPVLAKKFGLEVPDELFAEDFLFTTAMNNKHKVWEEIVEKEGLVQTKMEDLANWVFLDQLFRCPFKMLASSKKTELFGFPMKCETIESILYWVDSMREDKFIP